MKRIKKTLARKKMEVREHLKGNSKYARKCRMKRAFLATHTIEEWLDGRRSGRLEYEVA